MLVNRPTDPGDIPEGRSSRIAAMGVFDGVHSGHRSILNEALAWAKKDGVPALAMTFSTHPDAVIQKQEPKLIISLRQRIRTLEAFGFDAILLLPFNETVRQIPAERFAVDFLARGIGLSGIVVGPNFRFGHKAAGTVEMLTRLGEENGFGVRVVEPVLHEGNVISSSSIRSLVENGQVEKAANLMGRPFHLRGQVVLGQRRGHTIGFPTANLAPDTLLRPAMGVYATTLERASGEVLPSVTNVGVCPTFGEAAPPTVETHVLDFEEDIYGEEVGVAFHQRLRSEKKFDGPEALVRQIQKDVTQARDLFKSKPFLTDRPGAL